jgi:hypothetical protein
VAKSLFETLAEYPMRESDTNPLWSEVFRSVQMHQQLRMAPKSSSISFAGWNAAPYCIY